MKLLLFAPLIIGIVFFLILLKNKKKPLTDQARRKLLLIGISFCALSIVAVLIAVLISGDKTQLLSLSLPTIILILAIEQLRQNKKNSSE